MPSSWSAKDERQYNKIKKSCTRRGDRSARECTRMAAATVNKQRRKEGRTLSGYDPSDDELEVAWLFMAGGVIGTMLFLGWQLAKPTRRS